MTNDNRPKVTDMHGGGRSWKINVKVTSLYNYCVENPARFIEVVMEVSR